MDSDNWQRVRELFDAVCDLHPSQWRTELARISADPAVVAETLELLQAQTVDLSRAQSPLRGLRAAGAQVEQGEGERLGPWRLCERLASGGMGVVFRAERADGLYAQEVAVKVLHAAPDPRIAERLAAERRILAGLHHPNIARLYDGGTTPGGQPYLVMEYVRGQALDVHCRQRRLDLRQRLALFLKVCAAVQAAHARLVLHCDLKPANILVRADGEPVLLDFGIARLIENDGSPGRQPFFTPGYAAPELCAGEPEGMASDVYSLGIVLAGLLAAQDAARGPAAGQAPLPPSRLADARCAWRGALRGDLDAIAMRAVAAAAPARYASVEALAADVRRYLEHRPVLARGGGGFYRGGRWLRRNRKGAAALAGVLLLVAAFVCWLAEARAEAERQAQVAEQVSAFLVSMFEAADPREKGARAGDDISAREVLDRAAARVDAELEASPEVQARLKGVIGLAYRNMGDLKRANPMMRASAEALAARGGARNIDEAARQFNLLAGSHANNRDGREGEALARRALALLGQQPADSFRVAQSYNSLGLSLLSEQRYGEAEAAFRQALQRHELARREQFIGVTLDNLGMMYRRKGELAAAAAMFERSTPIFLRMFGPTSFDYWSSHSERSLVLLDQGRLDEAIAAFEANLVRAPRIFGERSVYYVSENNRLAGALIRRGDYLRADGHVRTALRLSAEVMGKDSFNYSAMLETAAQLAEARDDPAAAEAAWREALAVRRAAIGDGHPDTLDLELQLGLLLARHGHAEGDALVRHAHAAWLPRIPAGSANGLRVRQGWAEWLLLKDRRDDARAALASMAAEAAAASPETALRQQVLQAMALQREGDAAAVAAWREVVAASARLSGADSARTARWRLALAGALARAGGRGEQEAARAAPVLRAQLAASSPLLRELPPPR